MNIELGVPGQIMPPADRAVGNALKAEAKGYDSVWWPCHLMGWHPDSVWTEDLTPLAAVQPNPHVYFDPLLMMAAVGSATERIRVGSVVTDLIRRNPAMVAMQTLTLDHLTKGRAILGLGSGEAMNVTPYGLPFDKPVARLSEGIDVIRRLWEADGPVHYEGRFHQLESAVLGLSPYAESMPPIWTAAHGPRMLELTGRQADGWLPTKLAPEKYGEGLATIRAAAREAGRDADPDGGTFTPSLLAYVLLAPDEDTLVRMCEHPLVRALCVMLPPHVYTELGHEPPLGDHGAFHAYLPSTIGRREAMAVIDRIPPDVVRYYAFCGTTEQVADDIAAYHAAGLRHLICWNITAFGDPSLVGWSFKALDELHQMLKAR
jgi:phthiodiolone/phenolphthiodiolone dimycocerosates ketoreductase